LHAASSLQKRTLLSKGGQTTYVKAVPLRGLSDVKKMKDEIAEGHILIVRIAPIARRSIEDTKNAVNELKKFVLELGGDIARLGTERIVITPPAVKIWRGE
jgi:SepF-like predicted cell division protein (DUF552 family)